jgi:hypothetical protein
MMSEDLPSGASNQASASRGFEGVATTDTRGAAAGSGPVSIVAFAPWGVDATEFEMAKHAEHKSPPLRRKNAGSLWQRAHSGGVQDARCASSLAGLAAPHPSHKTVPPGPSRVAGISPQLSQAARVCSAVAPIMLTLRLLNADYRIDRMTDQRHG